MTDEKPTSAKAPWRRYFLINRRATWLQGVMASDLGAPAKVVAYALCLHLVEKTMTAQVSQIALGRDVGMDARRVRAILAQLIAEGWIAKKDGGRSANTYTAIENCGPDRSAKTSQNTEEMRAETTSNSDAYNRTKTTSQADRVVRSKTTSLTDPMSDFCEDENGRLVRSFSVGCEDVFGRLSGRKQPHSTIDKGTIADDAAPKGAPQSPDSQIVVADGAGENSSSPASSLAPLKGRSSASDLEHLAGFKDQPGDADELILDPIDAAPLPPAPPPTAPEIVEQLLDDERSRRLSKTTRPPSSSAAPRFSLPSRRRAK